MKTLILKCQNNHMYVKDLLEESISKIEEYVEFISQNNKDKIYMRIVYF